MEGCVVEKGRNCGDVYACVRACVRACVSVCVSGSGSVCVSGSGSVGECVCILM